MSFTSRIEALRTLADAGLRIDHLDDVTSDVQEQLDALRESINNLPSGVSSSSKTLVHSVDVTSTSSQSLTANTPAEIVGLNVTLTPQSTNSKFLLTANWNGSSSTVHAHNAVFGFKRDSSYIGNPASAGPRPVGRGVLSQGYWNKDNNSTMDSWDGQYLDEPNTTNSITYKVFIQAAYNQTLYNNRTENDRESSGFERASSSLIIIEFDGDGS